MNYIRLFSSAKRPLINQVKLVNYVSQHQHPLRFLESENKWRENDGISKQYKLIYKAPMENILKYTTAYLTFSTVSVGGLGLYYALFQVGEANINSPVVLGGNIVIANSAIECFTYLGAFVAFHIAVKIVLSRYVVRLYQHEDNYIAVFRGHLFNSILKHQFRRNEVNKLKRSLIVTWSESGYALGKKKAILLDNYFKTPECLNNLQSKGKESDEDK